ncbi:MAG: type II secretion system F family protein [Oscillospiraceae bacterium]|nr:type II secretion system F family protein [Oscillospiraceae bacterium]
MKQRQMTNEELSFLFRELGNLFAAGIGGGDAFALLSDDTSDTVFSSLFASLSRACDEGTPLHRALRHSGVVPHYACSLLSVGEQVGKTESTLRALGEYYDSRGRLLRQLKTTLLYPTLLLAVMLVVVLVLLVWVLPVFNDVYARLGSSLTGVAGALLTAGNALRSALPWLLCLLALVLLFAAVIALSKRLRKSLAAIWRRIQGDRGVSRRLNTARFVQALAMGLHSGLTETEAVTLAMELTEDIPAFAARAQACLTELDGGGSLPASLRNAAILSASESRLLETGVRSGSGDEAMQQLSRRLSDEAEEALATAAGRIEPGLVALMSILVGLILLSVMLPLMQIMTAIG